MYLVFWNAIYNGLWSSAHYYLVRYNILFAVEYCLLRISYTLPPASRHIDYLHHWDMSFFTKFHFSLFFVLRNTLDCSNHQNDKVRFIQMRQRITDEILIAGMVEVRMILEWLFYASLNTCVRTGLEYVQLVCSRID